MVMCYYQLLFCVSISKIAIFCINLSGCSGFSSRCNDNTPMDYALLLTNGFPSVMWMLSRWTTSRSCRRARPWNIRGAWNIAVRTRGVFTHRMYSQKPVCAERGLVRTGWGRDCRDCPDRRGAPSSGTGLWRINYVTSTKQLQGKEKRERLEKSFSSPFGVRCGARTHDTQNHNLVLYQLN